MKELQELINIAEAAKSSAKKQLKNKRKIDGEKKAWLKGTVTALDFIIREAELLLAPKPSEELEPQLQQPNVTSSAEAEFRHIEHVFAKAGHNIQVLGRLE